MKLGVEDMMKISAARQLYGRGKARHERKYLSGDIGEIFGLERPRGEAEYEDSADAALRYWRMRSQKFKRSI